MENKDNLSKSDKIIKFIQKYGIIFWLIISLSAVVIVFIYIYKNDNNSDNDIKYNYVNPEYSYAEHSSSGKKSKLKKSVTTTVKNQKTKKSATSRTTKGRQTKVTPEPAKFPVEINSVSKEQLVQIEGIGNSLAERIIDYRRKIGIIYNMELLKNIDGIGEKKLNILKQYLYVDKKYYREITQKTSTTSKTSKEMTSLKNTYTASKTTSVITSIAYSSSTVTSTVTTIPIRQRVNINTADAEELSEKLLIDISVADDIVILRNNIKEFSNPQELLYVIDNSLYNEIKDYIDIK